MIKQEKREQTKHMVKERDWEKNSESLKLSKIELQSQRKPPPHLTPTPSKKISLYLKSKANALRSKGSWFKSQQEQISHQLKRHSPH